MPYDRIPGVSAVLRDGGLIAPRATAQPRVIVLGTASSGDSYRMFTVTELLEAENEFGATSELLRKAHEVYAQGGNNIGLMRIGGTRSTVSIRDDASTAILTITPELRDDLALERYGLVIELNDDGELRILIWDHDDEDWAFDSDEVYTSDNSGFEVEITGEWNSASLIGLSDSASVRDTSITRLLSYYDGVPSVTDPSRPTGNTFTAAAAIIGTDGTSMSLVERYAALEEAYELLDYRDGDMIVPCGVNADSPNIAERNDGSHHEAASGAAVYTPDFSLGVPTAGDTANDVLGWLWQYLYRGKVYTYFCDGDIFDDKATLTHGAGASELVFTAVAKGFDGENVTIEIIDGGTLGNVANVSVLSSAISIEIDLAATTADTVRDAVAALAAAAALVSVTSGGTGVVGTVLGTTNLALSVSYLNHEDLTGDPVPAAVEMKFLNGNSNQLRECNFAHQLASFCYRSSTAWKTMLGFISMKPSESFGIGFAGRRVSRAAVRVWAGDLPEYTSFGRKQGIDAPADNGSGVLGYKLLGGASGYRYAGLDGYGDAQDGLAYGGLVMTRGLSLPNEGNWVYGISTNDELNDAAGFPVDIGRHIFITYDYPVHNNSFNGGSTYRGTIEALLAGKLASMPENQEPIGPVNGSVVNVSNPLPMTASLTNQFAEVRAVGLMVDERGGTPRNIIVTCRTAAHPDSDYTRVSTIRCVNREIQGIRNIAMPYIGQSFSSTTLVSLQQAIDGFLKGERSLGYNQGAVARLSYTREDRIMGRLTVTLRMVPPFALEAITIQVSLAAEEAEL